MTRKMGPALLAGNTIVVKSHEGTPISALEIAQLSTQLDFPPGVINVVSRTGEGLGAALVRHPIPRLITLTGSVRAGKDIFRSAADDLKLRSEEHTSELQSLMRISYAVFCLKKKNQ